jgi:hypothetical protein
MVPEGQMVRDDGAVEPLGTCAIVRDTHAGDHDVCIGTVEFVGFSLVIEDSILTADGGVS